MPTIPWILAQSLSQPVISVVQTAYAQILAPVSLELLSLYTIYLGLSHSIHTVEMERWFAFFAGALVIVSATGLGQIFLQAFSGGGGP
ncbi:hypothetical protein [Methylacidimicrobium sp. B4]|uniref:hypothetical protein n=1 Tax=Methylacidimicrobium sp. B4 TaxID=2796139 RepID=UPI001A8EA137|nr:hypothetical protein [Methylacidimicrobium sp. B4]QSR85037.1 hypothetical protein MacB4_01845 [Methylacidimicrobium sp. B4]